MSCTLSWTWKRSAGLDLAFACGKVSVFQIHVRYLFQGAVKSDERSTFPPGLEFCLRHFLNVDRDKYRGSHEPTQEDWDVEVWLFERVREGCRAEEVQRDSKTAIDVHRASCIAGVRNTIKITKYWQC